MIKDVYEIGELVSVVDNWWDMVDTQEIPAPLPLFDAQVQEPLCGIIVNKETYPGTSHFPISEDAMDARYRHHGLYHVLLSTGKVKKYFHNRLDKIELEEEGHNINE